jgi:hypothetical protein
LIAGDETSKNNGRTSNKNMNMEAWVRTGRKKREVQFIEGGFNPGWEHQTGLKPVL